MWQSVVNGQNLKFRLAGINNQNFIMRDEETGSWWQQISGQAIQGPLKGSELISVETDELTFGTWKKENPNGRVLKPDAKISVETYDPNWEPQVAKMRVTILGLCVAGRMGATVRMLTPTAGVTRKWVAPVLGTTVGLVFSLLYALPQVIQNAGFLIPTNDPITPATRVQYY